MPRSKASMRIMNRRCSRICCFLLTLRSSLLASHTQRVSRTMRNSSMYAST